MTDLVEELRAALAGASVPELRRRTERLWRQRQDRAGELFDALVALWSRSPSDGEREIRMGIAMLLGAVAVKERAALEAMTTACADDPDWRVQEALAKGLDRHCALRGWQESVPLLESWLTHAHPHVRRAAAEGPRVWTGRPYFADHPDQALRLLGLVRADESSYVRKSAANALSDISKKHPELVLATLSGWTRTDPAGAWTIKNACRHLSKSHPDETARVLAELRE
ncbi:DNA alkylation repair protein [Nonomuraea bangladeshensis]|uniref:DNA alkylation repair protein n=1 Tax=Nonomuraea bangladeshensis TaxID=404385 RepID=UPI0031D628AB